jgi:serine/threonine protein kinase
VNFLFGLFYQRKGLHLRKYRQLPADVTTTQARRIRLYRDIADALSHLHSLGIVHADVRADNVLFDDQFSAILCDFSAASPCGQPVRNRIRQDHLLFENREVE